MTQPPDEPACGKHGVRFMFDGEDHDGKPMVECVACMKLQVSEQQKIIDQMHRDHGLGGHALCHCVEKPKCRSSFGTLGNGIPCDLPEGHEMPHKAATESNDPDVEWNS